ncbi:hypothetical protein ANCCAN_10821 [Ancylostoma caninum]|uniref:Uncharacterized protein n=1 Tax=Ancylostoma caninum TaxID=29170 RepID=A0A368GFT6_ANCCA|nr:hypothetical protein ANCCAN_10821 [Ancylostoma caninum]
MFSRSQFLLNGSVWQWTRGTSKEILYEPRINSLPLPFAVPWSKFLSEHAWGRTAIWFGEGLRCTTSTSATCSKYYCLGTNYVHFLPFLNFVSTRPLLSFVCARHRSAMQDLIRG